MKGAEFWAVEEVRQGGGQGPGGQHSQHLSSDARVFSDQSWTFEPDLRRGFFGGGGHSFSSHPCPLPLSPNPPATVMLLLLVACSCCCAQPRGRKAQVRPVTPP